MLRQRATLIGVLLVVSCMEAGAEVSVRTDRKGDYVMTQIIPSGTASNLRIWSVVTRTARRKSVALNPQGDANGDLWPTVAESPAAPRVPWVVWSRFDGTGYSLSWSRWSPTGWLDVRGVGPVQTVAGVGDFDPRLAFGSDGRPFLVWSRLENGSGAVYVSVFMSSRWSDPLRVSAEGVDARKPDIDVTGRSLLRVRYETDAGTLSQVLLFQGPVTITDDINPQSYIVFKGLPILVKSRF
ncbi:MAG TPA: hypothetical protein VJS92_00375 [Candidatus Polarisedimenticolaceae bacterium]|nr:hypothetical protein [Candidatus Polarisedimenticolaceae bacterium]